MDCHWSCSIFGSNMIQSVQTALCKTLDFTWEREWRIRIAPPGALKLDVRNTWHEGKNAIIVERNEDVLCVVQQLHELAKSGESWPQLFGSVISLETAKLRMQSQPKYGELKLGQSLTGWNSFGRVRA